MGWPSQLLVYGCVSCGALSVLVPLCSWSFFFALVMLLSVNQWFQFLMA